MRESGTAREMICYCFSHTREDIEQDVLAHGGVSTILARILEEKQQGGCSCAANHPLGR
jgi:hypothetical protein